jgi:hypothetical protein
LIGLILAALFHPVGQLEAEPHGDRLVLKADADLAARARRLTRTMLPAQPPVSVVVNQQPKQVARLTQPAQLKGLRRLKEDVVWHQDRLLLMGGATRAKARIYTYSTLSLVQV